MKQRKSYDTRIKYLARKGLLPDFYRKQINRSLISKWKKESPDKYIGYELNENIEELYDLIKKVSEDQRMQKAIRAFYRINKTLKDIIGKGSDYVNQLREHKYQIIDTIHKARKAITIKKAIRLMGISRSTYRTWAMEAYFKCNHSLSKLCNNAYPQQLTVKEIRKMHKLLSDEKLLHWPIISVAYYGIRKSILKAHPNTWYKYARLMKINRIKHRKIKKRYNEGLRANAPNEKWHADVTQIQTADGKTSYIYLVVDNFSRYITSWRVSDKICAKVRLETFEETIAKANLPKQNMQSALIVDGGSENNNKQVNTFIEKYSLHKYIALKDILHSNAMAESINKVIKYQYLFPSNLQNQEQLIKMMSYSIQDYNDKRPHGALAGLTPYESYKKRRVDFTKIKERMKEAQVERVEYNRNYSCYGCPFDCK